MASRAQPSAAHVDAEAQSADLIQRHTISTSYRRANAENPIVTKLPQRASDQDRLIENTYFYLGGLMPIWRLRPSAGRELPCIFAHKNISLNKWLKGKQGQGPGILNRLQAAKTAPLCAPARPTGVFDGSVPDLFFHIDSTGYTVAVGRACRLCGHPHPVSHRLPRLRCVAAVSGGVYFPTASECGTLSRRFVFGQVGVENKRPILGCSQLQLADCK